MKIKEDEIIRLILEKIPSFRPKFEKYLIYDDSPTPYDILSELSMHVNKLIRAEEVAEIPALFMLIEEFMTQENKRIVTAAATCFLENLQNFETPAQAWVPLLGPESKDYCESWDAFTGARTEGLYD